MEGRIRAAGLLVALLALPAPADETAEDPVEGCMAPGWDLDPLWFADGVCELSNEAHWVLARNVAIIGERFRYRDASFEVLALSSEEDVARCRAWTVAEWLVDLGVSPKRVCATWIGMANEPEAVFLKPGYGSPLSDDWIVELEAHEVAISPHGIVRFARLAGWTGDPYVVHEGDEAKDGHVGSIGPDCVVVMRRHSFGEDAVELCPAEASAAATASP